MRLLHFADLHLHTPFSWIPPESRSRRRGLRETLTPICMLAGPGSRRVVLRGDLYEQNRSRWTPGSCARSSQLAPVPVFVAPGKHDWFGPQSLSRQARWSSNVVVFTEDRLTRVGLAHGLTLWGAAHRAPANTPGFLDHSG